MRDHDDFRMDLETKPGGTHTAIIRHMEQRFGGAHESRLTEIVPDIGITVHIIPPGPARNFVTLFTAGMSDRPMNVPEGQEEFRFAELIMMPHELAPVVRIGHNNGCMHMRVHFCQG